MIQLVNQKNVSADFFQIFKFFAALCQLDWQFANRLIFKMNVLPLHHYGATEAAGEQLCGA